MSDDSQVDLQQVVEGEDIQALRNLLNNHNQDDLNNNHPMLLHALVESSQQETTARTICYMLCNAGLSPNHQNEDGDSPLHCILRKKDKGAQLCMALLQCGADIHLPNHRGLTVVDVTSSSSSPVSDIMKEVISNYSNGQTLKELALDIGTEHIIRLIKDIHLPMKLAHSVLAGDISKVKELCLSDATINTEFRNLGDMGATPLFYAIMQNNITLVSELMSKGAKPSTTITFEEEDIPIYFTSLNKETDPEIIRLLTPARSKHPWFLSLLYRGNHVLLHCIKNHVHPTAVLHILREGYSELVALRNQKGSCARDVAENAAMSTYVEVIDSVVYDWYLATNGEHRKTLALLGYPHLRKAAKDGVRVCEVVSSMETSSEQAKFDTQLNAYQEQITQLHEAVEAGNLELVQSLMFYHGPHKDCFRTCLVNSLAMGETQPLLIKAVLCGHLELTKYLCRTIVNQIHEKVDSSRDAFHRTALHYAYAVPSRKDIVNVLLDHGASEFTMDKNERSPLVFRELSHLREMQDLVFYHMDADFEGDEPSPFTVKRSKIPLTCGHTPEEHLKHRRHGDKGKELARPSMRSWWGVVSSCTIL
ncbi:hypothetical protein CAPTEDRAFT_205426 [Capitella teleta]|uniref:Uncharacterized protein n=1 Tax=Capitella teleta TaxID=283909 RepID=R7TDI8_CAPTE|nr:hypothetical protein CAPTEDRAFT_205426 [Capitella teleta]|eukprot:ELT91784.1 hypothetical protein CAPTEDRAFT_205426 [Capitella teleta]